VLAALERRGRNMVEARIGTTYALAAAATILFLAADPYGEAHMVNLLKGDITTTQSGHVTLLAVVYGAVVLVLLALRKELLLVSFDRELAMVFGRRVVLWDGLLYLLIGITISLGVMTAGPLVTFGFLVVPALTARLLTRRMLAFSLTASLLGAAAAFVGFWAAYRWDLPLGPSQVATACVVLMAVGAWNALGQRLRRRYA
jgi:ABC-type Mn2+/Zn2+ transport system permease subunit